MINEKRLKERIEILSKVSETHEGYEGVTRRALSREEKEAHGLVKSWMEQARMKVHLDPAGNLIGRKEGKNKNAKPVVIGSHMDSVVNGGEFDGVLGVLGGIEVVQHIAEERIEISHPIEVIAFCEEEGSRFNDGGMYGSRAMVGKITTEHLEVRDPNGISRKEALKAFGLNTDEIFNKAIRKKGDMALYLEMHIEQGPVLDGKGVPIGIVSGINGRYFGRINIEGQANHCGGTPMTMRSDALLGASEVALALEEITFNYGLPAVGTVSTIKAYPGAMGIISGRTELLGIDIRDLSNKRRDGIVDELKDRAKEIATKRGLTIEFDEEWRMSSALSSKHIIDTMKIEAEEMNLSYIEMASGACHDAQFMAEICDMGMIFVRSTGGSHNPKEHADMEDIVLGTKLLARVAIKYLT